MKNRMVKVCMMAMLTGSMAIGSSVAVWAEEVQTEAGTESVSDTEETTDMEDLYGYWKIEYGVGYIFTPDHHMYYEDRIELGRFDIVDGKAVFDVSTLNNEWAGDAEDPEIILELEPMDLSQFKSGYDASQYYVDDTDCMLKITTLQKEKNDPLSTEKVEEVFYGVKSKLEHDNQKYLRAMLFGHTWVTDNGTLTITKDGELSLNDGEQTGTVKIYEESRVDFRWEEAGHVEYYRLAEADKDQIVLEKRDDPGQKLVLKNEGKLEEEADTDTSA